MSDYQKVEINKEAEAAPYSAEDLKKIEDQSAEAPQEQPVEEEQEQEEDRPEWLPEKFNAPEDLAKAYSELQAQFTKKTQDETPASEDARDFSKFTTEFAESGDLSSESVSEIESWGIPRDMIDGYVEGQKAVQEATFATVYAETGGEAGYKEMLEWAASSLEEGEQDAFNKAVMEGSRDEMMFAVRGVANRWKADGGQASSAPLVQGSTGSSGSSGGFRSLAEMTNAMKDPRYSKDPAYRRDIEDRLKVSNIL